MNRYNMMYHFNMIPYPFSTKTKYIYSHKTKEFQIKMNNNLKTKWGRKEQIYSNKKNKYRNILRSAIHGMNKGKNKRKKLEEN